MPQELLDTRSEKISEVVLEEKKEFSQRLLERIKKKKFKFSSLSEITKSLISKLKVKLASKKPKKKAEGEEDSIDNIENPDSDK